MDSRLNKYKYPGAKRLMLEAQELKDNTEDYCAQPLEDNLFEWHFTVRGPPDTAFDGGFYHGRLSFPTEYPMKPPSIILLTPNGRFETNKKICLSISGYHPETWQPSWSVRTALLALIAFMPTKTNRAIGSLDFSDAERRELASKSKSWKCESCGLIKDLLIPVTPASHDYPDNKPGSSRVSIVASEVKETVEDGRISDKTNANAIRGNASSQSDTTQDEISSSTDETSPNEVDKFARTYPNFDALSDNTNTSVSSEIVDDQSEDEKRVCRPESHQTSVVSIESPQRFRSTLVFRSIFILLLLLVLRRIALAFLL